MHTVDRHGGSSVQTHYVTGLQITCFQVKYPEGLASSLVTEKTIPEVVDVFGPKVSRPH